MFPDFVQMQEWREAALHEECTAHRAAQGLPPDDPDDLTDCENKPCWAGCPLAGE